jgi:hypothetical protein
MQPEAHPLEDRRQVLVMVSRGEQAVRGFGRGADARPVRVVAQVVVEDVVDARGAMGERVLVKPAAEEATQLAIWIAGTRRQSLSFSTGPMRFPTPRRT